MTDATTAIPGLDFLQFVLESLVEDRDELKVEGRIDDLGVLLTVSVSARDMGKLIGKGGQTVKALRTLIRVIGGNTSQRINIKILEPEASGSLTPSPLSV
ncbi:MAG: KH domain-containing protein [Candidatus Peribacteraceae bacterium]|nr:KH domain-containing protein [Candidatus Peribacteraceae bacterium]